MKKLVLILALVALVATPAIAGPTIGDVFYWKDVITNTYVMDTIDGTAKISNPTLGTNVGWIADLSTPYDQTQYFAFCVEKGITFSPGATYLATFDTVAYSGAIGGGMNGDPISQITKYIVDNHAELSNTYSYSAMRDAIWYAEEEDTNMGAGAALIADLQAKSITRADTTENVLVVNSWKNFVEIDITDDGQDNKVWVAQDVQSHVVVPVPAPGAILLGSMGLGLVGWLRRRNSL